MINYFITEKRINEFCNILTKNYRVFMPKIYIDAKENKDFYYQEFSAQEGFCLNPYRVREPLKVFFFHPFERVSQYFLSEQYLPEKEKIIVFGVKNCDLVAHRIQDYVFLNGDYVDSIYEMKRKNTILISSDCTDFKKVCHCLMWEILPYPQEGFDLNLSKLNDGYVVEIGSDKGERLVREYSDFFSLASDVQVAAIKFRRESFVKKLREYLDSLNLVSKDIVQKLMKEGYHLSTWKEFMLNCVECGGCNFICDTCHCFLLKDSKTDSLNEKIRVWDSCQYANFSRVAGGANPLNTRAKRLRNRFLKKFDFFIENLGIPACCGCGRCIEVCPGKIDIREVLKDLANKLGIRK